MINALAITGPTASGKTAVSIELARSLGAEIICCDSMQIYKEMDIGTAKATAAEREAVPHYMLDFLSPSSSYSAEDYRAAATERALEIASRGKIPLFVGGTGLYIDAVMRAPMAKVPESSREYRDAMLAGVKSESDVDALWQRLREVDPVSADAIHKNNLRRVVRALEIYEKSGKPKSYFDALSREASSEVRVDMITLDFHDRENLYRRVNDRVDEMLALGLLDEVRSLHGRGLLTAGSTAAQAIGYKEIILYLEGEITLDEAVEEIKLSTRRYAKRQLTWFRHEKNAYRLYIDGDGGDMRAAGDILTEARRAADNFIKEWTNEGN